MKSFAALMRLQLLSRYADFKPQHIKEQLKEKQSKMLWRAIGVVILIVYLLGFLITIENAIINSLTQMGVADLMISLAVSLGALGTLIMAFFFVMSALYFNRDSVMLAALPIHTRTLLTARLTQVWLSETGVNALILLPAGIIYGIKTGVDPLFYARLVVVWLTLSILPIAVVSWVSTLLIRLSALWKRREMIATVCGIVFLVGYMFLCMNMGMFVGDNGGATDALTKFMLSQQGRIETMFSFFPPLRWAASGLLGDYGQLLLFVGVSLVGAVLTVLGIGCIYRKLSLMQGETSAVPTKRSKMGNASYANASVFRACCLREWRALVRVPTYAVNTLPTAFMPVFMIFVFYYAFSRTGDLNLSEEITGASAGIPASLIVGGMAALMAYMMGINPAAASAVTREGRGHDLLMSLPIPARTNVMAKLTVTYGISLCGALAGTIVIMALLPSMAGYAVLAFVLCALYGFATTALALSRDVRHPRLDWVTEQEAIKQQSGVLIGLLISWGILIALGVISFFLITIDINVYLYAAVIAVIEAVVCWLAYHRLMKAANECLNPK